MFRQKSWFDLASLLLIIAVTLVLLWEPTFITTQYDDITYHLLTAQNFQRAGGITTWEFWASLPLGRPHNYPPLLHTLLAPLTRLTIAPVDLAFFTILTAITLILLLGWWSTKCLFGSRVAFLFLTICCSTVPYIVLLGVIIPASLVIAATPLLLLLIKKNQLYGVSALLTLMFYTQMILPWLVVTTLIIWGLINRQYLKKIIITVVAGLILYLPWLTHILLNLNHIKYLDQTFNHLPTTHNLEINLVVLLLFVAALGYLFFTRKKLLISDLGFFVIFWLITLPIIFYRYPNRFTLSSGFFAATIIIAYAAHEFLNQYKKIGWLISGGLLIIASLGQVSLYLEPVTRQPSLSIDQSFWLDHLTLRYQSNRQWLRQKAVLNQQTGRQVAQIINQTTKTDDVIYSHAYTFNASHYQPEYKYLIGQLLAALSNRSMANSRLPESLWQPNLDLTKVAIIVADIDQHSPEPQPDATLTKLLDEKFIQIGKVNRLVIFKNKTDETFKALPGEPVLPLNLALIIIAILLITIATANYQALKST